MGLVVPIIGAGIFDITFTGGLIGIVSPFVISGIGGLIGILFGILATGGIIDILLLLDIIVGFGFAAG